MQKAGFARIQSASSARRTVAAARVKCERPQAVLMAAGLLLTACDTGSANALAPVLKRLACIYITFAQAHAARVFDGWGIPYRLVEPLSWAEFQQLGRRILNEQKPKAVLTGTSWGSTLDKALTLAAREQGIPCAAVIEHWDLYRERFSVVVNGQITNPDKFLPDRIWVNDEIARAEAVDAGLPGARIEVVGQPHLERQFELLSTQGVRERDDKIVFVSERVREDFTPGSPLYRGFDEFETLKALRDLTDPAKSRIVIKLHPQESADKYDRYVERGGRIDVVRDTNNTELILSAGRIVGMFSMLLLEAALVRNDVISFMPAGDPSVFVGNRMGATLSATTTQELKLLLRDEGVRQRRSDSPVASFGSRFLGSTKRMIKAIETLIA